jgi:hypothetical protein
LRILEVFVAGNRRSGYFPGFYRPPVESGYDPDHVGLDTVQPELRR